jgi:hypothetical protein
LTCSELPFAIYRFLTNSNKFENTLSNSADIVHFCRPVDQPMDDPKHDASEPMEVNRARDRCKALNSSQIQIPLKSTFSFSSIYKTALLLRSRRGLDAGWTGINVNAFTRSPTKLFSMPIIDPATRDKEGARRRRRARG